jgi:hypothetical protein
MKNSKNGISDHETLDTKSSDAVSDDLMKGSPGKYNELNNSSRTEASE